MKLVPRLLSLLMLFCLGASAQTTPAAVPADPRALLARAREVMGMSAAGGRVLHYRAIAATEQPYQSDRMYPPFFSAMSSQEIWLDPAAGVLRLHSQTVFPGDGPSPTAAMLDDGSNAAILRGSDILPVPRRQATARNLSPWAVIADWSAAAGLRLAGTETFRDYPRTVLARTTAQGEQRLYLDPKTGFPVKLDFVETHYLWGQQHLEYIWSTWVRTDGAALPGSAFRVADGQVEISQTVGAVDFIAPQAAPPLAPLPSPAQTPPDLPRFLQPIAPTVLKVAPDLYILSNPGYNEAVALAGGQLYLFDATQGEERARQDAAEIARLFPGRHKINLVVTDTAWPHIAGLRYWVAQGATVLSHARNHGFLQRVIDRKWTSSPDSLEIRRSRHPNSVRLNFVPVDRPVALGGGAVRLVPIDGIGSELALMAYLPAARFLWASDYIQTLAEPSLYAAEVLRAAEREAIRPERVAAEHLPLTDWQAVRAAQSKPAAGRAGQ